MRIEGLEEFDFPKPPFNDFNGLGLSEKSLLNPAIVSIITCLQQGFSL